MNDTVFLIAFPYLAVVLAVMAGLYRYFANRFSFSSLSSQFLEHRALFWGSVPWHYGIVPILLAHLLALLFPSLFGYLLGQPVRLTVLELLGLSLGLLALVGVVVLIVRRILDARARAVTSVMDWVLLVLLCLQVGLGVHIAIAYRWGSLWYLYSAVPWLHSLARFQPDAGAIGSLPAAVRLHMVLAFVVILLFPFGRLVHMFTFPIRYLLRPWQVVIWYRDRAGGDKAAESADKPNS